MSCSSGQPGTEGLLWNAGELWNSWFIDYHWLLDAIKRLVSHQRDVLCGHRRDQKGLFPDSSGFQANGSAGGEL
jgi:hypothetical protein